MARTRSPMHARRRTLGAAGLVTAVAVLFSGCVVDAGPDASSPPATAPEVTPLTQEGLASLLAASAEDHLVPGAIAMVTTPAGTVSAGYGTTTLAESRTPQASDVFRIGSVTKTMTAAVILQQVGEQKLALSDPIERFVPGVPNGQGITIADLLQMRSGLQNYLDTDGFASVFDEDMTTVWSPQQLVDFGFGYPAVSAPDTSFDYSNTNTTLLGMVAEQLDGKPLADIFDDRLFDPLGMTDTQLPDAATTTLPSPLIEGYQYGTFPINHRPLLPAAQQAAAVAGTLEPNAVSAQSPSWSWAAGGVVSTANDLMTWAQAMGGSELLGDTLHQAWLDDLEPMDPGNPQNGPQYGLGIEQTRFGPNRLYYHEGELPGFNTFVATDLAHDVRFVVWTNLALSPDGQATAKAVATALIGELYRTELGTPALPVVPVAGSAAACVPNAEEVVAAQDTQSTRRMSVERAAAYDAAAASVFAQVAADAPAVTVAVRGPDGTWTKAYGVADLVSGRPASVDMYQRIGSVTKTFVGTALLQLADQGKLSLDDPIDDYVPNVPNGSRITLRQLVSMTSGLPDYQDEPTFLAEWLADPAASFTSDQLLAAAWALPTKFPPGTGMFYSNTNYVLLGLAIEQVTGTSLAEVIETQILDPLQMDSTTLPTTAAIPSPHLNGYSTLPNALTGTTPGNRWVDVTGWNPQLFGAAGAMTSQIADLLTWGRVLGTGQGILEASTQVQRLESFGTSNLGPAEFYGDGLVCKDGWVGHAGTFMGYNTNLVYHPDIDTTIVVGATGEDSSSTPPRVVVTKELTSALAAVAGRPYTPFVIPPALQVQGPVPEL